MKEHIVLVETFVVTFRHPPVQRIDHSYEKFRWLWWAKTFVWLTNHTPLCAGAWQKATLL